VKLMFADAHVLFTVNEINFLLSSFSGLIGPLNGHYFEKRLLYERNVYSNLLNLMDIIKVNLGSRVQL
jgi:hypothetical protein